MSYLNVLTQRPGKGPGSRTAEMPIFKRSQPTFVSKNPYENLKDDDDEDEASNRACNAGKVPLSSKTKAEGRARNSESTLSSATPQKKAAAAKSVTTRKSVETLLDTKNHDAKCACCSGHTAAATEWPLFKRSIRAKSQKQAKNEAAERRKGAFLKGTPATMASQDLREIRMFGTKEALVKPEDAASSASSTSAKPSGSLTDKETPQHGKNLKFGGHLCPLGFDEQASMIRERCMIELQSENKARAPRQVEQQRPINAMPQQGEAKTAGEWMLLSIAIDSGASETVIPHTMVKSHPILETEVSKPGMNYASATGEPIPNLGEQKLPLVTCEETLRGMTFQAAPVSRALGSVKRLCSAGHRCVFDEEGSYIENKNTGEINWLREEDGNYMLDTWVMPKGEVERMWQGFTGQP
jgi:hypothetical protein